jgi:cytoskeletal protein RodZ
MDDEPVISRKKRALRTARNIAISTAVLLVLVVGAGVAYTWYMGQQAPVSTAITAEPEPVSQVTIKPTQPAANAPVGASIQMMTSPVAPGSNVSATIKTTPTATCTILVEYDKVASKDSGLSKKVADDFGVVMWTWTVEETVPVGKWPVTITCALGKKSGVVIGDLVVSKEIVE